MSIKISPKHGLNPTIPICFWCGEQKNEIALLGQVGGRKDIEVPMSTVLDYEPCEHCKEQWEQGFAIIPLVKCKENERPLFADVRPTGAVTVIKRDCNFAKYLLDCSTENARQNAIETGKMYVDIETFESIMKILRGENNDEEQSES